MKRVVVFFLLFITNISIGQQNKYTIDASQFFGGLATIKVEPISMHENEKLVLLYSEFLRQFGLTSSKVLNVYDKLKSPTIIGKVEFTFNNSQKLFAEGVLNNFEDDNLVILNLTTPNKNEIFKKIFNEQVVAVKIILSAPYSKKDESVIIEEKYDFREEVKALKGERKEAYDYLLEKLNKK